MKQLDASQVAAKLNISRGTLINRRSHSPHLVPPARRVPGTKRLIWLEDEVDRWILEHATLEPPAPPRSGLALRQDQPRRPRGRPRKIQPTAEQQQQGGAA